MTARGEADMLHRSPLLDRHRQFAAGLAETRRALSSAHRPDADGSPTAEAEAPAEVTAGPAYLPYGPVDDAGQPACELLATLGDVEPEYAAIRRHAAVFDAAHRGTLRITGSERRDFLNRMLTADLKSLDAGAAQRSFWLTRQGRIRADLLLIELGDELLVDVGVHEAQPTVASLDEFLFAEDVEIADVSSEHHHLDVHGRRALDLLRAAVGEDAASTLAQGRAVRATIGGVEVVAARNDQTGEPGIKIITPYGRAVDVWDALLDAGENDHASNRNSDVLRVRPTGWYAFNIARIEAGTPLFNIDFSRENLPHETGVVDARVSFRKGCYLGQEIVARMQSLGRPKQVLMGFRCDGELLPVAEAPVHAKPEAGGSVGEPIGSVSSSTLSPMLGLRPIGFAMIRSKHADVGERVLINAEGQRAEAELTDLVHWPLAGPTREADEGETA